MCRILFLFLVCSFCSCTAKQSKISCPEFAVKYERTELNSNGNKIGIFLLENKSDKALYLQSESENLLHGHYAWIEEADIGSSNWHQYNPLLEEILSSDKYILLRAKSRREVAFDGNGLFLSEADENKQYSLVLKPVSGCIYRSEIFNM